MWPKVLDVVQKCVLLAGMHSRCGKESNLKHLDVETIRHIVNLLDAETCEEVETVKNTIRCLQGYRLGCHKITVIHMEGNELFVNVDSYGRSCCNGSRGIMEYRCSKVNDVFFLWRFKKPLKKRIRWNGPVYKNISMETIDTKIFRLLFMTCKQYHVHKLEMQDRYPHAYEEWSMKHVNENEIGDGKIVDCVLWNVCGKSRIL